MPIKYIPEKQIWVITTDLTDYVIGVDAEGILQHVYWGGKQPLLLDYMDLPKSIEHPGGGPIGPHRDEIMPWGGLRFTEPGIKLTFSDHIRDLHLIYDRHELLNSDQLVIYLKDTLKPLTVKLNYKVIKEYDLIERYVEIVNEGTEGLQIEQLMGAIWHLPVYPEYRLTYLAGLSRGETQVRTEWIQEGKKVLESRHGRTSHQFNPWFAIDFGQTTEEYGDVYFGAIAFSGNWKIVIEKTPYQTLQVATGFNDFDFGWTLKPGEILRSPICIGGFTAKGFGEASRQMHRYQKKYILRNGHKVRKVMYNSWYATEFDVTEEGQRRLAEQAAKLGVELFVVDDGWFGARDHDRAGLGDWFPNKRKFPKGLHPLIQHVKSLGMDFGIWVEPEMVNRDSDLYRSHPDWVYRFPGRRNTEQRNQLVLNLSRPDVEEYIFSMLDDLLSNHEIDYIKWDMNRSFSEPGWPEAPPEHHKEIWVRHVLGVYRILERLQRKHPHVAFESCSGGGARIDLGIMRYIDNVWPSDNTDPFDRLFIQEGYTYAYNTKAMLCWVTDVPDENNLRTTTLKYRFHSAMIGSLGIGLNLNKCSELELQECKKYIRQYKEIRPIIQDGDLYRILSPRSSYGAAFQYVSPDRSRSVLFVFRHRQQFRHPFPPIQLRGLDPEAVYLCRQLGIKRSGTSLMTRGISLDLRGDYASELIVFEKDINY
ncbi:alpha-galactosidase [Geobacillus sp. BMUD]|uniref:alpha-galactosidase n=1 Tax=Geobacillus sp. BMUD TaxID=2508876 RepID=UPI00149309F3|nr:alpha-galactosidase [Geobacillus sp. BMUD]NNU83402.1 alpha-galactosidase [Geobacillus sp. BMUD]